MGRQKTKQPKRKADVNKANEEFLFGINPVTEAFKAKRRKIIEVFIASDKASGKISEIITLAGTANTPVSRLPYSAISKIAVSDAHQGVTAKVSPYPYAGFSELITGKENGFLLILDGIEDPQNLGAIARTALCAGADGIIIPKDRAATPTPWASKASAGALEHIKLARVTNLAGTLKELKKKDFWIAGLDANADNPLYKADLTSSIGIVIGGEDRGIRELVRKNCDFIVSIPQKGRFNSLNASVAGAVIIYEVVRQREET